ncbi:MAG: tyrosine-type recombinase/integrase [Eggerthellaceae bacterium]|nr:tyrosine-type recombinase/integrase [Eggerthellaceae bacterium]
MGKSIGELLASARRFMEDAGYSEVQLGAFQAEWNAAASLCEAWGVDSYDASVEQRVIAERGLDDYWALSAVGKRKVRALKCLLTIDERGEMPARPCKRKYNVPEGLTHVEESYRRHLVSRGVKRTTVESNMAHVRAFLGEVGCAQVTDITCVDVVSFLREHGLPSPQSVACRLYCLRAFLRFLVEAYGCDDALASMFPVIPAHKEHALMSTFSSDEVAAALAARPASTSPLRGRAILLMGALTGMRAVDIRGLRFEDLDWRKNLIRFTQRKTGVECVVHMPEELRLAIIDYLKNERPNAGGPLFLSSSAPLRGFEESGYTFHRVASAAYDAGGVDVGGRHHGMHSLRHSVATRMLSGDTALPVISGVLGHSNANTTRKYLAVDVERLREFALEVPRG